jgi:signal transduction histidine kinase
MRERVEMVGGTFGIESSRGHGTVVRADVPIEAVLHG